jgi:hypothetical protein
VKSFDFFTFLKDITNQYVPELQDNVRYDDLLHGIEDMFDKLYTRVQEINILNTLDIKSDRDFTKYVEGNEHTVGDVTKPYKDVLLEQIALYLNTDHFRDTVAVLMRLWQERDTNGGLVGVDGENLETFIESYILPSFRFFTMNSGDLHKSKGIKILLDRLMEFYGQVEQYDPSFTGVEEIDRTDDLGKRFVRFTSPRESVTLAVLLKNYQDVNIFTNVNLTITQMVELGVHRFVVADGYLFISRRDRDDWHIINIVDEIFKLSDEALIIKQNKTISMYRDDIDLYDTTTNEFVLPSVDTEITSTNVEFTPKVINIRDKFDEYHNTNFYFITMNISGGKFHYDLKRVKYRPSTKLFSIETIQADLGITYLDLLYKPFNVFPRVPYIRKVDYIWFDFYDESDTVFDFYPSDAYPASREAVKMVYAFEIEVQIEVQDANSNMTYPIGNFVCVARDGYNYTHLLPGDINNFAYNIVSPLDKNQSSKFVMMERNLNDIFTTELNKIIGDEVYVRSVLDCFIPKTSTVYTDNKYTSQGDWNAANETNSAPSNSPTDGDYWTVSNAGTIELNGIKVWNYGDVVTWNGDFSYWEKKNDIPTLVDGEVTNYLFDHRMIVVSDHEFENDNVVDTPFEEDCGLFFIQLSSIPLNVSSFNNVINVDTNPVEKFGEDGLVLFTYKDKSDNKYYIYSIRMNGFFREKDSVNLNKVLKDFPLDQADPVINKCEVTDKSVLVYCVSFNNITNSKSEILSCENLDYLLPFGLRGNDINLAYDADTQLTTRTRQIYFQEYTIVDDTKVYVEDQEVQAFKSVLERYSPINTVKGVVAAHLDLALSTQTILDGEEVETFPVDLGYYGIKDLKEVSLLNNRDDLSFSVLGTPEDVNCDCKKQLNKLYLYNYDALTPFYDSNTETVDPGLAHYPYTCCVANKVGKVNDENSGYEDACRFDTGYLYFTFNDGVIANRLGRQRFYVNLFDQYQAASVAGASGYLNYNWSIVTVIEVLDNDPVATFGYTWISILSSSMVNVTLLVFTTTTGISVTCQQFLMLGISSRWKLAR